MPGENALRTSRDWLGDPVAHSNGSAFPDAAFRGDKPLAGYQTVFVFSLGLRVFAAGEFAWPPGPQRPAGLLSLMGEPGPAEADGLACSDLDGDGLPGLNEDMNVTGIWTAWSPSFGDS